MDLGELMNKIAIEVRYSQAGFRTTELIQLYRKVVLDRRSAKNDQDKEWYNCEPEPGQMKKAILELAKEKRIKFVTEQNHRDYCWIVAIEWVDRKVPGYIHVPKIKCEPFDLW